MKDKATYAGIFDCLCVDIYTTRNIWVLESEDFTLPAVCRDPQGQWHLRRWRILLLLRLLLLVVEVAAGPPPPLAAPAGSPVWAHRTGWGSLRNTTRFDRKTFCEHSWNPEQRKHWRVTILEPIKCGFGLLQPSEYYFTVLLRAVGQYKSFHWKLDMWVWSQCHKVSLTFSVSGTVPENRWLMTSETLACFPATVELFIQIFPDNHAIKLHKICMLRFLLLFPHVFMKSIITEYCI